MFGCCAMTWHNPVNGIWHSNNVSTALQISLSHLLFINCDFSKCFGHKLNERGQKSKTWERDWIAKRQQYGAYHGLVREIRDSDPAAYRNFLRMDDEISFHHSVQNILVTDQLKRVNLCPNLLNFIMYIIISNNLWTKF